MPKLETWIKPVRDFKEPVAFAVSDRYIDQDTGKPAEWTLVQVDPARSERIQEQCFISVKDPETGNTTRELDNIRYLNALMAETIQEPDLRDKELQACYKTSNATETLNRMLSIAEKNRLIRKITELYNLDQDILGEEIEDVKNA